MLFIKSHSLLLHTPIIILIILLSSTLIPLSNGDSMFHDQLLPIQNKLHPQGIQRMERSVIEENNVTVKNSSTLILAAEKTHRRDPFNNYSYYTGGWDYRSLHYWASVTFSAAPLFITAVVWFVVLGVSLCCACLCCCCCRSKKSVGYSQLAYALSLFFLILSTAAVIIGCIVLYINQDKFSKSVAYVLEFILKKGISIFESFMSIVTAFGSAAKVSVNQVPLPPDLQNHINSVNQMIQSTANVPQLQSIANAKTIQRVLVPASLALNIVAAIMLILALFGLLCAICGFQCCIYVLAVLGWILVTMAFILCGIFLIFHNAVADTCVAMDDWLQNPTADSPLSLQFLPCMDKKTAEETLATTKETSSYMINSINTYISEVANKDLLSATGPLNHKLSGPLVPLLCNPFNSDLTDRKCVPAEVNFTDADQEWKKNTCEVSGVGICITPGRLTPATYAQMTASANVSYTLYSSGKFLVELLDCSFVLNTFKEISDTYCPSLRRYSFWTYVGLVIIAASVMCSLIFWLCYGRERQHRKTTNKYKAREDFNPFAGIRA
ncbi:uncharacterized protein LOC126680246 [Mercurialis annua]|uniref:uncharacterized protein LOC126680246 n=1 Tax=Mercurialis annua TaxID=3986 RepID=UPI00215F6319|nr:uncharacterized protein LOC126680246 [Mercurialis annua]